MIKINLLGDETAIDHTAKFVVGGYLLSIVVSLISCYLLYSSTSAKIRAAEGEIEQLETKLAQLKEKTTEARELEKKRDELEQKLAAPPEERPQ